jgi:hypothetical protein
VAERGPRVNWIQRLAQLAGGKLAEQVRQYTSGGTLGGAVGGTLGGAVGRTAGQGGTLGGTAAAGLLGGAVGRTAGQFGDYQGAMPPPGGAVNQYYYPTPSPTQTQGEWQQGDPSQYRGLPDPGVQIQTPYPGQPGNFMVEQNPQYGGLPPPSVQFATGHQYNAEQERAARMKLYAERMARERANAIWQGWQRYLGQW